MSTGPTDPRLQERSDLPLTDLAVVDALGNDLRAVGFDSEGVLGLLGEPVNDALVAGTWWPALDVTARVEPEQRRLATVIRLLLLGVDVAEDDLATALPTVTVDGLVANGVVERVESGRVRAVLDIRPHGGDDTDHLVISDQDAAMRSGPVAHDHVLGIGGASISLARAVIREPVRRALDLGTGCGIQALHMNAHCEQIIATDTNQRALALAAATARINGMSWDLRAGSLFEPVAGERFDLIVSNPPFVVGSGDQDYIYRDSGMVGDALCAQFIREVGDHLNPGGTAQLLANWIVREGQEWTHNVAGWLAGTGLDAWVVQRELADPISYVSLWLSDAGEEPEDIARRGARWLQWFAEEKIVGIGMGSITLRALAEGEQRDPDQVLEEIPGAGEEVTGPEAQAFLARRAYLREHTDTDLLATRLTTAPVFLDQQSLPGEGGWQQVSASVRRPGGPGAVIGTDEVFTALLAGCRGEVPLITLIDLLADFHGVESDALAQAAMPVVREAIGRGILYEAR